MPSQDPDPDDLVLASENAEALTSAIGELAPLHREALILTFVHGLSYQEIAEVLGVPMGTVKSRLFAAKRALRARLDESEGPHR